LWGIISLIKYKLYTNLSVTDYYLPSTTYFKKSIIKFSNILSYTISSFIIYFHFYGIYDDILRYISYNHRFWLPASFSIVNLYVRIVDSSLKKSGFFSNTIRSFLSNTHLSIYFSNCLSPFKKPSNPQITLLLFFINI
jgi:hypothetical protein